MLCSDITYLIEGSMRGSLLYLCGNNDNYESDMISNCYSFICVDLLSCSFMLYISLVGIITWFYQYTIVIWHKFEFVKF